jgi:hypothetical protein
MKLNQVIALVQGKKSRAAKMLTDLHQGWQKERISGLIRTYQPKEDGGETFPSESKMVQVSVLPALIPVQKELSDFYNIVATQEKGNTTAVADVIVEGQAILACVPVSLLLFLEKQLVDIHTLIGSLPTLSDDKTWSWDTAKSCWVTDVEQTAKGQKKIKPIVKYDATKEHPAQTDLITVDETVGYWSTVHLSGALPKDRKIVMIQKVERLQDAVKVAREVANGLEVVQEKVMGDSVLNYIFS